MSKWNWKDNHWSHSKRGRRLDLILFVALIICIYGWICLGMQWRAIHYPNKSPKIDINSPEVVPDYLSPKVLEYIDKLPDKRIPSDRILLPNGQTLIEFNPVRHTTIE